MSEQIQCEADDIGPAAELDHWKRRTARFDCLLNEIRKQRVRAVTAALNVLKSKQIKKWKEMVRIELTGTNHWLKVGLGWHQQIVNCMLLLQQNAKFSTPKSSYC